jgi:CRISPR-associated endonuclease Csn1
MPKLRYRLGLDIGTNSIGWCVYELDEKHEPITIKRLGARIFSDGRDPKSLASKASSRRLARQMRRRRDRVLKRRRRLLEQLVRFRLLPEDAAARKALQAVDPWVLRARGLDEKLSLHELGRAIYHLARKRGFRSSRKGERDPEAEKDLGKIESATRALRQRVESEGCRTVGEYLGRLHADRRPVRARRAADGSYVLYMQRSMVEEEFDRLWAAQARHHPRELTDSVRDRLRDTILFQRRLRPVRPGRCLLEPAEPRARLCSPLQQRFRILQELNNLRVRDGLGQRPLTLEERRPMLELLSRTPGLVTFAALARSAGLRNARAFNFGNDPKRKGFRGDAVGGAFASPEALGPDWNALTAAQQHGLAVLVEQAEQEESLVRALLALPADTGPAAEILGSQEDTQAVLAALRSLPEGLDSAKARALAKLRLPDDFGNLSLKALARIVPELENEVVTYDVAVQRAGYTHHSDFYDGVLHDRLPYYGELLRGYTSPADTAKDPAEREHGKIPNPTVHIGLNQLRQLVNALVARYGHPTQIVIELAREFGASGERRREILKRQAENQERNARYDEELRRLGLPPNRENRIKLQLWEELGEGDALDRYCVYSGARLSKAALFSDEIEVDHILPFSRSLHDGIGNKLLCTRQANREKGNRTPFEAFGHSDRWSEVADRAARLPEAKAKHFKEDALEQFLGGQDFLARHLTDTAYLGRAAKRYLTAVCPPDRIWVSSGRLTGLLRGRMGLGHLLWDDGRKSRNDHRHHALDAAVIGLCSRSLIQRLATAAARAESLGENRLLDRLDLPWPTFREDLRSALERMTVSHKPDHGREGALHNETNYGWRGAPDARGVPLVGRRVPVEDLSSPQDLAKIVDPTLRREIFAELGPLFEAKAKAKEIRAALAGYTARSGVRRVMLEERLSVIALADRRTGEPYRFVKGDSNYCYEIFRRPDGRWDGEIISTFEANQRGISLSRSEARCGLPLIFRLHKDDLVRLELDGTERCMRVAKFSSGMIALTEHNEANVDARTRDKSSGFKYLFKSPGALRQLKCRVVGVDVLGYVNDPGFRD